MFLEVIWKGRSILFLSVGCLDISAYKDLLIVEQESFVQIANTVDTAPKETTGPQKLSNINTTELYYMQAVSTRFKKIG